MPDVYQGTGVTADSVIAMLGMILPAAVAVDTGSGANTVCVTPRANLLADSLQPLRDAIEVKAHECKARHMLANAREAACKRFAPGVGRLFRKHPALRKS